MRDRRPSPTPGSTWQLRRLLPLGHRLNPIPAPLGGMAGHRKRSGARTQPDQLDQLHLAAVLPDVLAVGVYGGRAAPAPQLPRCSAVRLNPMQMSSLGLPSLTGDIYEPRQPLKLRRKWADQDGAKGAETR